MGAYFTYFFHMLVDGILLNFEIYSKGLFGEEGQQTLAQILVSLSLHECNVVGAQKAHRVGVEYDLECVWVVVLENLDGCVSVAREQHEFAENDVP